MACSKSLQETVCDVTECSICTETMVDPRVLPCIHTFCFKCLDQLWKDKQPGVKVPCPMCRTEVVIPVEGVSTLPKNFFVEKLIGAQKLSTTESTTVNCDVCTKHRGTASVSEAFCVECQQYMCDGCVKIHNALNGTSTHHVIPTGSEMSVTERVLLFPDTNCESHAVEKIKIYCIECKVAVCTICFITQHSGHKGSDIKQVAEGLKAKIITNIEETRGIVVEVNNQSKALEELLVNFGLNVEETQSRIVQKGEQMKQLIDKHVQALLQELDGERMKKIKEFEVVKEELLVQKLSLESFIKYSEKILEKAVPADVASVAEDLSVRFESLKNKEITRIGEYVEMSFIPNDSLLMDGKDRNVIGSITLCGTIAQSTQHKSVSFDEDPKLHTSLQFPNYVRGIATLGEQLYVVIESLNVVNVFNSSTLAPQSSIPVTGLVSPCDLAASENLLFVGSQDGKVFRIKLPDKSVTSWSVGSSWASVSVNKHGNVIVASFGASKLYEYTPGGDLLREIALKGDVVNPYRAMQIENDQFLVGQAGGKSLYRVCLIDDGGNLIKSFGSTSGSGNANLSCPFRLIVDRNGFILVADHSRKRVVLLNNQLKYDKDIIPASFNLSEIFTLYLDEDNGRLFLSDFSNKKIVIYDLKTHIRK